MNKRGKVSSDIMRQMGDDLMTIYRQIVSKYDCKSQYDAYRMCVKQPAPRYYVSSEWAYRVLKPMCQGDHSVLSKMSDLKKQMYISLFQTALKMTQQRNFCGKSLHYICQYAIMQPAPRFYIQPDRMAKIFKQKKGESYARA